MNIAKTYDCSRLRLKIFTGIEDSAFEVGLAEDGDQVLVV